MSSEGLESMALEVRRMAMELVSRDPKNSGGLLI